MSTAVSSSAFKKLDKLIEMMGPEAVGDVLTSKGITDERIWNYLASKSPISQKICGGTAGMINKKWTVETSSFVPDTIGSFWGFINVLKAVDTFWIGREDFTYETEKLANAGVGDAFELRFKYSDQNITNQIAAWFISTQAKIIFDKIFVIVFKPDEIRVWCRGEAKDAVRKKMEQENEGIIYLEDESKGLRIHRTTKTTKTRKGSNGKQYRRR